MRPQASNNITPVGAFGMSTTTSPSPVALSRYTGLLGGPALHALRVDALTALMSGLTLGYGVMLVGMLTGGLTGLIAERVLRHMKVIRRAVR